MLPSPEPGWPSRRLGIEEVWPDCRYDGPGGAIYWREHRYPSTYRYGNVRPAELVLRFPTAPAVLAGPPASELAFSTALFLDTETTGLAGGTGTYVFLIGAARFFGGDLVVRQFFLHDLHQERALLQALEDFAEGCGSLVTFNGKCFDLPLLQSRHIMQRSRTRLPVSCHFDLLYPARRIWTRRLRSCALTSLEREILAVFRHGDVPGSLIPELYFRYLRTRDASPLLAVFDHNRRDVLALAALAVTLCAAVQDPVESVHQPLDLLALGKVFEQSGQYGQAERCYQRALGGNLPADERAWAWVALATVYGRTRRREEALPLLQAAARHGGAAGLEAAVRLAKYLEHHVRDYPAAADATALALGHQLTSQRLRFDLQHRMARLQRKRLVVMPTGVHPAPPA